MLKAANPFASRRSGRGFELSTTLDPLEPMQTKQENMQHNPSLRGVLARSLLATVLALLGVSAARAADYQSTVLSDGPRAYYRFNDDTGRSPINRNSGSLGAAGGATNSTGHRGGGFVFRAAGRGR